MVSNAEAPYQNRLIIKCPHCAAVYVREAEQAADAAFPRFSCRRCDALLGAEHQLTPDAMVAERGRPLPSPKPRWRIRLRHGPRSAWLPAAVVIGTLGLALWHSFGPMAQSKTVSLRPGQHTERQSGTRSATIDAASPWRASAAAIKPIAPAEESHALASVSPPELTPIVPMQHELPLPVEHAPDAEQQTIAPAAADGSSARAALRPGDDPALTSPLPLHLLQYRDESIAFHLTKVKKHLEFVLDYKSKDKLRPVVMQLTDPPRAVIDLAGAPLPAQSNFIPSDTAIVNRLRTGRHEKSVRFVFDLASPAAIQQSLVTGEGRATLRLLLEPVDGPPLAR